MYTPTFAFSYELPQSAIAQVPIEPRDSSRLLDTRDLSDHTFRELPELLAPGDLLVVNRSKVRTARLIGTRSETGGRVEILLLRPVTDAIWEALARPARKFRIGTELIFGNIKAVVEDGPRDGMVLVSLKADGNLDDAISAAGRIPLPPYIRSEISDPERYQTIFAKHTGSAAAPTAGLHFTDELVAKLADRSIEIAEVELRIGLDTFHPISTAYIEDHRIHTEDFEVPEMVAQAIAGCRSNGGRVVAVGTTVVRALETAATGGGLVEAGHGSTGLFITPGFRFRVVDLLITNFHLPATSLIVLVASFMGEDWRSAYETALAREYRFASFGDSMLASCHASKQ